ncbi:MAG: gamma-glutamyltransferase [candidate division Zixibacteria bacterium HGW-Zixibacteria-1]|nr:MAG: gamma-glutamyltransferase [candidate division Zixibacteria bacterium HGW-Zixibacteria-1]
MRKHSPILFPAILLIAAVSFLIFACGMVTVEKYYPDGVVATASPIATDIGLEVLKEGGNAVDAAVAVGFALAVCYPEAGNIGGGGFAMIRDAQTGRIEALDFRETAPAVATKEMYLDEQGNVIPNSSLLGAKAAGVPGTVAGLYEMWKKYGSLDWYRLIEPAIKLADTGFLLDDYFAGRLAQYARDLSYFPETKSVFFKGGSTPAKGEKLTQKELASALERIGLDSLDGFYSGETADLIVQSMEKNGGMISHEDLSGYRPVWRQPVHFKFDSLDIYSMPPPSSGGVIIGEILKIIEPFDFFQYSPDHAEYIHLFTEACRLAYADRAVHLGDPAFVDNPVAELLNPNYLESRRALINLQSAANSQEIGSGLPDKSVESESTTHFCISDKDGNLVSLTYTINASFGSKLVVEGAGFLLNNEMDDFSIKPGVPNLYGLIGGRANEIEPGKRMLSSMSPTIVMLKDRPFLALGAPGGSKIITTVAEAIINFTRFDLNLQKTVECPRFHHQWMPDTLYLELGGFDINVKQDLISRGHVIKEIEPYSDLQMVHIAVNGLMSGASDPRKNGRSAGF